MQKQLNIFIKNNKQLKLGVNRQFLFICFLIALSSFRLPNIYLFPFISTSAFLTTQALGRIIIVCLFTVHIVLIKSKILKKHRSIVIFIMLFFIFQSVSIIEAVNILSFIRRYKDIVIGILSFFVFYHYRYKLKTISYLFIIISSISLIYQYLFFFFQETAIQDIIRYFVYSEHWNIVVGKLYKGKLHTDTYDEINTPLFFLNTSFTPWGIFNIILGIGTILMSFLSNIRSRIIMMLACLIGYIVIIKKLQVKIIISSILGIILLTVIGDYLTYRFTNYSFIDRITLQDEHEDVETITDRFKQIENSIDMASSSVFGVGLGNYFDSLPQSSKNDAPRSNWQAPTTQGGIEYVHNYFGTILAETGFISFGIFIVILFLCMRNDIQVFKRGTNLEKAFVISFWSLFSFGLLNPPVPGAYQVLFWGLRGITLR